MMKWFRKHNKKLLAVFASALLVVWLGGQALQQAFQHDPTGKVMIHIFGQDVSRREWLNTVAKAGILQELGIRWQLAGFGMVPGDGYGQLPPVLDRQEWFCLLHEAKQMGMVITRQQVDKFLQARQDVAGRMEAVRDRRGVSLEYIRGAVTEYLRVISAAQRAIQSVKVSEPQVRRVVRDMYEKVRVRLTVVRARDLVDKQEQLSREELRAHFEKYKDHLAGEDEGLGYGYRWGDRVVVEYVGADIDAIKENLPAVVMRRVDSQALKYYRQHHEEFTVAEPASTTRATTTSTTSTTATTTSSAPATSAQAVRRLKSYGEVKAEIVDRLLTDKALKIAGGVIGQLGDRLQEPWYDVETDEAGYKEAPEEVRAEGYLSNIVAEVSSKRGIPIEYGKTGAITIAEAAKLAGIGRAAGRDAENRPLPFAKYAFRTRGLPDAPTKPGTEVRLSLYEVTRSPLRDSRDGQDYNFYLFRVIEVVPSSVPESMDELPADKLAADLREYKAYMLAGEHAARLAEAAGKVGLEEAVKADEELTEAVGRRLRVLKPPAFSRIQPITPQMMQYRMTERRTPYVSGVGRSKKLVQACFELGATADAVEGRAVRVVDLPGLKCHVVVQWVETEPVTDELYEQHRRQMQGLLYVEAMRAFRDDWFSADQIRQRTGFRLVSE